METTNRKILIWGVLLLASLPLVFTYVWQTLEFPQYHFVPALVIAFGLMFYSGWDRSIELPRGRLTWSYLLLGAIAAIVGATLWSPWLGTIGFLLILGSFLGCCNIRERWRLLRLWPLSWLILRLPLNLDFELTRWLQRLTARLSSLVLDRLEVPHHLAGNVFHLPNGTLFVEEACSGIQSVFALMFLAVLWLTWQRRSWFLLPIYLAFAVAWAGVMNVLRVTFICYAQERWQLDLAHGLNHEILGYSCLLVAIILLLSSDRLLRIIFYPTPAASRDAGKHLNPISVLWNRMLKTMSAKQKETGTPIVSVRGPTDSQRQIVPRFAVPVLLVVSILVLGSQCVYGYRHWSATPEFINTEYWKPNETLISQVPGLEVIGHETSTDSANPALGIHADLWSCRFDGMPTRILVSQHAELHDLCLCYGANGWNLRNRQHVEASQSNNQGKWDVVEASFVNSETIFGELFFSTMDRSGHPVRLRGWTLSSFLAERLDRGSDPTQRAFEGATLNIQLWTTSEIPFTEDQREKLRELHRNVREIIRNDLANVKKGST